jgi:Colicin V production protein
MSPSLLLAIAALIIALKTWHGWKLGVVRQAVGLVALVGGVIAAVIGGPVVEPFLDLSLPVRDEARTPLAGLATGIVVYLAVTLCAVVLFKKTEHQTVGVIRFGYGFLGAVLGAVSGALIAAVLLIIFAAGSGDPGIVEALRDGNFAQALEHALKE